MNKFVVNVLIFLVFLSFASSSQATLITNLTQAELDSRDYSNAEDHLVNNLLGINYINYKGYDWAWVSPVNLESFGGNTLYAPELQKNWKFADQTLLNILKTELTLADFTTDNGDTIHSAQFFNSEFDYVDETNFNSGLVSSEWTAPDAFMVGFFGGFETFYVRKTTDSPSIPEPSTLIIFALGLIALVSKKRLFS